jgi:hypothetical protein
MTRISQDQTLVPSGMRELSAALGIIGRGSELLGWKVDLETTTRGHHGALRLHTPSGEAALFFAANAKIGIELELSGIAPAHASDVLVVHSAGPPKRTTRSPHGRLGRTGLSASRHVDMAELLRDAASLDDLEERFRREAVL